MHSFAAFILRSRMRAVVVAVVASVLSLILPPLSYISGASIALVTLRNGGREGLLIAVIAVIVMAGLGMLSNVDSAVVKSFVATMVMAAWMPVIICAQVLRTTRALSMALLTASLIVLLAMMAFYLLVGDVTAWWHHFLTLVVQPMLESSQAGLATAEMERILASMAGVMTGFMAASMLYSIMLNLFLARWWQALLFNPGGFRAEFHALRMGPWLALLVLVVLGLSTVGSGWLADFAANLLWLLLAICSLLGLALLHAASAAFGLHKGWLIALYVLMMLLLPLIMQMIMVLSALGLTDSVIDFRRRFRLAERQAKRRHDEED